MPKKSYALCYTVKNDKDLLLSSCLYHLKKGCSKIYVFDDGSTDGTIDTIRNIKNIEIHKSTKPNIDEDTPQWIKERIPNWDEWFDVRKMMNTYLAAKWANTANIDWLGSIDSDEIIFTEYETSKSIIDMLNTIHPKYDQILLKNLEAVAHKENIQNPFLECKYFFKRHTFIDSVHKVLSSILFKLTKSGKIQAWFDYYFYKYIFLGNFRDLLVDPIDGTKIPPSHYLAYKDYKSLIKTAAVDNYIFNIHKWIKGVKKPKSYISGNILHYDLYNSKIFKSKFSQRPKNMLLKVFYLRYRLALIALNSSEKDLITFFNSNIVILKPEESKYKKLVIEITDVKNTLNEEKSNEDS